MDNIGFPYTARCTNAHILSFGGTTHFSLLFPLSIFSFLSHMQRISFPYCACHTLLNIIILNFALVIGTLTLWDARVSWKENHVEMVTHHACAHLPL